MYLNYKKFAVNYDDINHRFSCFWQGKAFVQDAGIYFRNYDGRRFEVSDYGNVEFKTGQQLDGNSLGVFFSGGVPGALDFTVEFALNDRELAVKTFARGLVHLEGLLYWGDNMRQDTWGVRLNSLDHHLRGGSGPVYGTADHGLFDRQNDAVLEILASEKFKVAFDWERETYRFAFVNGLDYGRNFSFMIREHFCRDKFNIPYRSQNANTVFAAPPVGWMTWYSVQFSASAAVVADNAVKFKAAFGNYSETLAVWVDWEWCHRAFDGLGEVGADIFHPRQTPYPDGLNVVADRIKNNGMVPILWIGATNDNQLNAELAKHPEWILAQSPRWCGQYWVDPTAPGVMTEYIPKVFQQIKDWGYQGLKWDCLPVTLTVYDEFHDRFADQSISSDEALREMVKTARSVVGEDFYMLSCSGMTDRDITVAMDLFDAARIGGDVFGWQEFAQEAVDRVFRYYPFHNTVLFADADNLVLRSEFNNLAQARSRVSFYGLSGLPVTVGDAMDDLDFDRIHLLRRIMPVLDTRPRDLQIKQRAREFAVNVVEFARPWGNWLAVGVMNSATEANSLSLSIFKELGMAGEVFAVYDFWQQTFLGVFADIIHLDIAAYDTTVLRITPLVGSHPQLVGTSRHITQGGFEVEAIQTDDAAKTVTAKVKLTGGEVNRFVFYLPEGCRVVEVAADGGQHQIQDGLLTLEFSPEVNKVVEFTVKYL